MFHVSLASMCRLLLLAGAFHECQFDHIVTALFRSTKALLLFCLPRLAMTERAAATVGLSTSGVVQGPCSHRLSCPLLGLSTPTTVMPFWRTGPVTTAHGLSSSDHLLGLMSALSETPPCASDEGGPSILLSYQYQGFGFMSFGEM